MVTIGWYYDQVCQCSKDNLIEMIGVDYSFEAHQTSHCRIVEARLLCCERCIML